MMVIVRQRVMAEKHLQKPANSTNLMLCRENLEGPVPGDN
jgi:hypothetical protein